MSAAAAHAKINLALVVGARRADGLHEVATVLQRVALADRIEVEPADALAIEGFPEDTLVRRALEALAGASGVQPRWAARIEKRIPVAAGLGGGSSDAATALRLANAGLPSPFANDRLLELAAAIGADVPFFLTPGPKLAEGAGERLSAVDLPQAYAVLLALAEGAAKASTGSVYARFDALGGGPGFGERRNAVLAALEQRDPTALPPNDLAESAGGKPLVQELLGAGAFRADVSGAGPAVYGLFERRDEAEAAAAVCASPWVCVTSPVW